MVSHYRENVCLLYYIGQEAISSKQMYTLYPNVRGFRAEADEFLPKFLGFNLIFFVWNKCFFFIQPSLEVVLKSEYRLLYTRKWPCHQRTRVDFSIHIKFEKWIRKIWWKTEVPVKITVHMIIRREKLKNILSHRIGKSTSVLYVKNVISMGESTHKCLFEDAYL